MRLLPGVTFALVLVLGACERGQPREMPPDSAGILPIGYTGDSASGRAGRGRIEFLAPASVPYPFSPAVRANGFIFVSGQIGTQVQNGRMVLVSDSLELQTRQTMNNIEFILKR